jgi:subtilase family serine protease
VEVNETNNCGSAAVQLGGTDLADSIAAVAGTVATGRIVQITDTVTSLGPGSAPPTTTKLYLSASGTRSGAAYLGSHAVPAITGAATSTAISSLTLPSWLAPGAYTLMACADETNAVAESNEVNNCGGIPVQLLGTDLGETINAAPAAATAGQLISVSDTLASSGPGSAPCTTTKFYLSLTGTKTGATYLTQRAAPALIGASASLATTRITLPSWMAAGTYLLLACADDSGVVMETNEANNCAASPLQVSRP